MSRPLEVIAEELDALGVGDFDEAHAGAPGFQRLYALCEELRTLNDPAASVPVLFRTIERLEGAETGQPGPLVHALESWRGKYEIGLIESLQRKPTLLAVWMVNRILNASPPDAGPWLMLLQSVAEHPQASETAKAAAARFLQRQARR